MFSQEYNDARMDVKRYRRIVFFFARIIPQFVIVDLFFPRFGLRNWVNHSRPERLRKAARSFRLLAIQLGGVLIKVGQFLSARADVLPEEITSELAGLQDEVTPEKFSDIRMVLEKEFEASLTNFFSKFDETPLAAASLGQVHKAIIRKGDLNQPSDLQDQLDVVVKIQRPRIEEIISTDLAALRTVGNWLNLYKPIRRRINISALIDEFTRVLFAEIDYLAEGRNAEVFAQNFQDDPRVRIPSVVWSHTTRRILTLENVMGIKITDYAAIHTAGISRGDVASRLINTYLKQIFEDGFFHADPHPGNLFVYPTNAGHHDHVTEYSQLLGGVDWRLTFVDFGMVGRVPPTTLTGLREMLIAVGTQDVKRMVNAYQMLGILLPNANLDLIEKALAKAFESFWGKSMGELQSISYHEAAQFAGEFIELIYTLPFQVPHDLILLARAVGILSGICTGLDQEFNVWKHIAPFAEQMIAREGIFKFEEYFGQLKKMAMGFFQMPVKIDHILTKIEQGNIEVQAPEVSRQLNRLEMTFRQVVGGIVFGVLFLGGIQLYLAGLNIEGIVLFTMSGLSLFWVMLVGRRKV